MMRSILAAAAALCLGAPAFAQGTAPATPRPQRDLREYLFDSRGIITPYPLGEQRLGNWFYREGYRLTPREYHRLRSSGFSQEEVYLIANASRDTGLDTSIFANAIYRGDYARRISIDYGILPSRLTRILPEWKSAQWAAATGEPAIQKDRLGVIW
jgi:hypothetical protein